MEKTRGLTFAEAKKYTIGKNPLSRNGFKKGSVPWNAGRNKGRSNSTAKRILEQKIGRRLTKEEVVKRKWDTLL